jgi:hypothetical protein
MTGGGGCCSAAGVPDRYAEVGLTLDVSALATPGCELRPRPSSPGGYSGAGVTVVTKPGELAGTTKNFE